MTTGLRIAGRPVGGGAPCFVIAEAGVNHNGSLDLALALVDEAAARGADAVKFQTFRTEALVTAAAPKATYQARSTGNGESQFDMLKRLELGAEDFTAIQHRCNERGIIFLSTPFDEGSADLLAGLGVPAFKISSGELTNLPFLGHVARKGRPIILSTGMADFGETRAAVDAIASSGAPPLALLHCVSAYPAPPDQMNIRAMIGLQEGFGLPVGLSDHSLGIAVALAAVALGAAIIEKHFTLDRSLPGPDHQASMTPEELGALVSGIRTVEAALGNGAKRPAAIEADVAAVARRSVVAARALSAGTALAADMLILRRPGTGIPPAELSTVIGRHLSVDVAAGTPLTREMLA